MSGVERVRSWACTDVGRVREHNEDHHLVDDALRLYIVADGMGGHAAGEVASELAARIFRETVHEKQDILQDYRDGVAGTATGEGGSLQRTRAQNNKRITDLLGAAGAAACEAVFAAGRRDADQRGMGTTLVALWVIGSRAFIAHIGDSRVYLVRDAQCHQLTNDHTLGNELLRRGRLTPEQVQKVSQKNALTRAVGVYRTVEVDTLALDLLPGDRFVLCSDGLYNYLRPGELGELLRSTPLDAVCGELVGLANERGGHDNITNLLVEYGGLGEAADGAEHQVGLQLRTLRSMDLFRQLSYQELVRIHNITRVREYREGDPVCVEGEEGAELYIVLEGKVRIFSGSSSIADLGPGEHFGEMSLVDRVPRSASASAAESSRVLVIQRKDFFNIVRYERDMAVKMLWRFVNVLTRRLRQTSRDLGEARYQLELTLEDEDTGRFSMDDLVDPESTHRPFSDIPVPESTPPDLPRTSLAPLAPVESDEPES